MSRHSLLLVSFNSHGHRIYLKLGCRIFLPNFKKLSFVSATIILNPESFENVEALGSIKLRFQDKKKWSQKRFGGEQPSNWCWKCDFSKPMATCFNCLVMEYSFYDISIQIGLKEVSLSLLSSLYPFLFFHSLPFSLFCTSISCFFLFSLSLGLSLSLYLSIYLDQALKDPRLFFSFTTFWWFAAKEVKISGSGSHWC